MRTERQRGSVATACAFRRPREYGGVTVSDASCLKLRSGYSECSACADACPVDAIRFNNHSLDVSVSCLGCGRCAATCPTGALRANCFPDLVNPPPTVLAAEVLDLECGRVPPQSIHPAALRVPCLGGVGAHDLLGLYAERRCRAVRVIDRGLCRDCPASDHGRHPASAAVSASRRLLEGFGALYAEGIAIEFRRLPQGARALPAPHPELELDASRRNFLRRLATLPRAQPAADATPTHPATKLIPIQKTRTLIALQRIATMTGGTMPALLFPRIEISERCANHGVCAALCPTGALRRYEADGASGVEFDAGACIACGDCRNACPEQALRLVPQGNGGSAAGATRITHWTPRECYECGGTFADLNPENLCLPCRKTRASFSQLFSPARGAQDDQIGFATTIGSD